VIVLVSPRWYAVPIVRRVLGRRIRCVRPPVAILAHTRPSSGNSVGGVVFLDQDDDGERSGWSAVMGGVIACPVRSAASSRVLLHP